MLLIVAAEEPESGTSRMAKIAFIGAGAIGAPLASAARRNGHDVLICDVAARVRTKLSEEGFRVTDRARECGASDAVIVVVETSDQVATVLLGQDGLLSGLDAVSRPTVVVVSTVLPSVMFKLDQKMSALGIALVDAPVSGGAAAAATGDLTVFVGGEESAVSRASPYLALLGKKVLHCGRLGAGQTFKIINNLVGLASLYISFESYMLGAACEVAPRSLADALMQGTGATFWHADPARSAVHYRNVFGEDAAIESMFRASADNLQLALELGREHGLSLPMLQAVVEQIRHLDRVTALHWRDFAASFHVV